ncbi:methyltransferase [Marisediminicola sp. LYQ85]|uniref:DUF7059 domain-containing protein n=1 Tax=Marisediminicola sp. LYQ85 TaxID=3391062 RepID=UPI0039831CA1
MSASPASSPSAPASTSVPHLVEALRADLAAAGFGVDTLTTLWGDAAAAALHRGHRVPCLRAVDRLLDDSGSGNRLAVLARLLVLNSAVSEVALAAALPTLTVPGAVTLGIVAEPVGGSVSPLVDLRPSSFVDSTGVGGWWIASDLGEVAVGRPLREDHVLGVGGASTTLSGLIVHRPVEAALDLGTGCGIQALHLSRHAARVVATDISTRALDFARFNAALNGVDSIEFRHGSLFDPVEGEVFDHIVSNPPFVITPRAPGVPRYEYRDGGLDGDALVESVLSNAVRHLRPGGIAQMLGNWEYRDQNADENFSGDAFDRIRSWVASPGAEPVDVWVVERERQDPAAYAETWIRDGGTRTGDAADALENAWLDDFATRGVVTVGFGYVTLRRPDAIASPPIVPGERFERLSRPVGAAGSLGGHLEHALEARARIRSMDDDEVLATAFVVAPDVTEERHYWPGADDPTVMTLRQGGGFGRTTDLATETAAFVGACDGTLTTVAIIAALAEILDADDAGLRHVMLPLVRELVETGVLLLPVA